MEQRDIMALVSSAALAAQLLTSYGASASTAPLASSDCTRRLERVSARLGSGLRACEKLGARKAALGKSFDVTRCKAQRIARFESRVARMACAPSAETAEKAFPGRSGVMARGLVMLNGHVEEIDYEIIDGMAVFDGDIELGTIEEVEEADRRYRAATEGVQDPEAGTTTVALRSATREGLTWPTATIPYEIDPALAVQPLRTFTSTGIIYDHRVSTKDFIVAAIEEWNSKTLIRLVERAGESDYLRFKPKSEGCASDGIGRKGGVQYVKLAGECQKGAIVHEIGHVVGLYHEQKRQDRDNAITMIWSNLPNDPTVKYQYEPYDLGKGADRGALDFDSIMMYGSFSNSVGTWQPVMVRRFDPSGAACSTTAPPINTPEMFQWLADCTWNGQREGLSAGDINGVTQMIYGFQNVTFHRIQNWNFPELCMRRTTSDLVQAVACSSASRQSWVVRQHPRASSKSDKWLILNPEGRCLTRGADFNPVRVESCTGSAAQRFAGNQWALLTTLSPIPPIPVIANNTTSTCLEIDPSTSYVRPGSCYNIYYSTYIWQKLF